MVKIRVLSIKFFLVTIELIIFQSVFAQGGSKTNKTWSIVDSLNELAENEWTQGNYTEALHFAFEAEKKAHKSGHLLGEAYALNNIGIVYDFQGKYAESLENYFKAIPLLQKIKNENGLGYTYNNIGLIYSNQKNYAEARKYYQKAEAIRKRLKDSTGLSSVYNNLGILSMYSKEYEEALKYYFLSVDLDKRLNDNQGISASYSNIGLVYMELKDHIRAENYFKMALELRVLENDKFGIANSYNNLSTLYYNQKKGIESVDFAKKGLKIGLEIGSKELIQYSYQMLYQNNERMGDHKEALDYYKLFIAYGDSILNENNTKKQTQAEMLFAFEQKEAENRNKQERKELIAKQEKQKTKLVVGSLILLIVVALVFSWMMQKRWRVEKEQKNTIEQQKLLVELKNKEILDSITYAKRIQTAILPPEKLVKEFLVDSFIMYKPKDIVAGDFYWMEPLEEEIIFAVADCTGHGVPGALVSLLCHNALNRSVREYGLKKPAEILDKTRALILEEFEKSDDTVNDGMDISLCRLNLTTLKLTWSGANSPLWILRNNTEYIEEIKPTKQPIGKFDSYSPFIENDFQLSKGDIIYLFTDGYADQFGGDQGKKMKSKKMKEQILRIRTNSMLDQQISLNDFFEQWRCNNEQLDDVCVIGLKI